MVKRLHINENFTIPPRNHSHGQSHPKGIVAAVGQHPPHFHLPRDDLKKEMGISQNPNNTFNQHRLRADEN